MIYQFGDHEIDLGVHEVRRRGEVVPVEPQVFDVLVCLVTARTRTVTKEDLLDAVWGDRFVSESALTSRIKAARRAVGDDGRRQEVIRTVFGRGYRFVADVDEVIGDPTEVATVTPASTPGAVRPPRTRYASSGGHAIAHQVLDDRPSPTVPGNRDVVFVPGFVSNLELQWEIPAMADTFRRLGRGRRLVLFDKRGTGVSERVALDRLPTLEERVDDVGAVMDAAGIERASLVGISEGGPLSLLFAASHPERVERLVLFGTYDHRPLPDDMAERTREFWGSGTAFELLAPSWAGDRDRRRSLARYERLSATPDAAGAIVAMANDIDVRAVLPAISRPTLVVHRIDDGVFPVDGARRLAAGIPGAVLVEVAGGDHLLFSDPGPVLALIDDFLDRPPTASAPTATVLTTLVAIGGPDGPPPGPEALAAALRGTEGSDAVPGRQIARGPDTTTFTVDGPARAVRLARQLLRAEAGWRAGVHTAEVELDDGRPSGTGVLIAAAVAGQAPAGGVLVTRTVTDLVAGSGLRFDPAGELHVAVAGERWRLSTPID